MKRGIAIQFEASSAFEWASTLFVLLSGYLFYVQPKSKMIEVTKVANFCTSSTWARSMYWINYSQSVCVFLFFLKKKFE